jgi:hypothetical protein
MGGVHAILIGSLKAAATFVVVVLARRAGASPAPFFMRAGRQDFSASK